MEYAASGRFEEAKAEFKEALKINPSYIPPKEHLEIIEDTDKQKIKKEAAIHIFKGDVFYKEGMVNEAIAEYKEVIKLNPALAEAHYNLGIAYYDKGMLNEAIAEYKEAIKINPKDVGAHYNLSRTYYLKKEYNLAIQYCNKAIQLGYKPDPEFLKALEPYRKK